MATVGFSIEIEIHIASVLFWNLSTWVTVLTLHAFTQLCKWAPGCRQWRNDVCK